MISRPVAIFLLASGAVLVLVVLWTLSDRSRNPHGPHSLQAITFPPIVKALERYREIVGHYPGTAEGLEALFTPPASMPGKAGEWPLLKGGTGVIEDPFGDPLQYKCPGTHNTGSYDLWCDPGPDVNGASACMGNWPN